MTSWRVGSDQVGQTAVREAKRGNKVGLIERREMGGDGCIYSGTIRSTSWREWVRSLTGFHQRGGSGVGSRVKPDRTMEDLVTDKTEPDWVPIMKRAAAIVTNRGGRTCHAAIVSRELGLPAIVGAEAATERLIDGQVVTVSCAEGETGYVYEGRLPVEVDRVSLKDLRRPKTAIMMNVANPEEAFRLSFLPNDGVGLAREEFIIANSVKAHPLALLDYERLDDPSVKAEIDRITLGYHDKAQFFVDKLAQGVSMIAAAFYPKDVIVRLSDFKSNEYANLIGGRRYEPNEENPMLGFRGASRYYDARYQAGFALECRALRDVREMMGLINVKIMIPFCRTIDECRRVLGEMARHGLRRGERGLEVYLMCEIPSNVILAEEFAELRDGFSIGSNDLTQLTLGVDRDSDLVAPLFDERNPAVTRMISMAIRATRPQVGRSASAGRRPATIRSSLGSCSRKASTAFRSIRMPSYAPRKRSWRSNSAW